MRNHTETPCFDFADTAQYMLEFMPDEQSSFSFTYSYMLCWELVNDSLLTFKFMNEEIRVEGQSLNLLKDYISKHQMRFLRTNAANIEAESNTSIKVRIITSISRNENFY